MSKEKAIVGMIIVVLLMYGMGYLRDGKEGLINISISLGGCVLIVAIFFNLRQDDK